MMSLFWFLAALGGDPCSPKVDAPSVYVDQSSMEVSISRGYAIPWAVCAQEKGGKPPVLRVSARDGSGAHVLLDKTIELKDSLRDGMHNITESVSGCLNTVPNRRDANAVLQGSAGSRRWYNRRTLEVELAADGPLAPLAFKTQVEVFCPACTDERIVSSSYYINDFDKNTARMVLTLDKSRYECAKGGGRMMLRRFWAEPGVDSWTPLHPYEVVDNLQDRLKPQGDVMMYELIEPAARFCKAGKSNLFEIIGIDEYAHIINKSYGPSDAIDRGGIEFLRCK